MSRKDYTAVAAIIKAELPSEYPAQPYGDENDTEADEVLSEMDSEDYGRAMATVNIASALADMFADDNPSFDRARFMVACGVAQ